MADMTADTMAVIEMRGISRSYQLGGKQGGGILVHALRNLDFSAGAGEFVSIMGPSGSGKSTLMNILGCLDKPSGGSYVLDGVETTGAGSDAFALIRNQKIGFVFQSFNLLPVLTVFENVELPLTIGRKTGSRKENRERVDYLLEEVGLTDRRGHKPAELSGGQQQRVAIARALVTRPRIVIADEPTANLDSANGERILELMKSINRDEGTTFIFSTHDPDIWKLANHVVFLCDGLIETERRR
jgi:putative ABC transport system ATP-binding protein